MVSELGRVPVRHFFREWHVVPWDYPNLSNASTTTSPFTIVFKEAGSSMQLRVVPLLTDTYRAMNRSRSVLHERGYPDLRSFGW
jgi:hypothetical protein